MFYFTLLITRLTISRDSNSSEHTLQYTHSKPLTHISSYVCMYACMYVVKLKIVEACINASITYSCESWGNCPINQLETLQRNALEIALSIKQNSANDVVYGESGFLPLKPKIYKRQYNYFRKLKNDTLANPHSDLSKIFTEAIEKNIQFTRHYRQMDERFLNERECQHFYKEECMKKYTDNLKQKGEMDVEC